MTSAVVCRIGSWSLSSRQPHRVPDDDVCGRPDRDSADVESEACVYGDGRRAGVLDVQRH